MSHNRVSAAGQIGRAGQQDLIGRYPATLEALAICHYYVRVRDHHGIKHHGVRPGLVVEDFSLHDQPCGTVPKNLSSLLQLHDSCKQFRCRRRVTIYQHYQVTGKRIMLSFGHLRLHRLSSNSIADFDLMVEKPADHLSQSHDTPTRIVAQIQNESLSLFGQTEHLVDFFLRKLEIRHLADLQVLPYVCASCTHQPVSILLFADQVPESNIAGQINQFLQLSDFRHHIYLADLPIDPANLQVHPRSRKQNIDDVFHGGKVIPVGHNTIDIQNLVAWL